MARGRAVKYPPKIGKLKRSEMKRVIREVVHGESSGGAVTPSRRAATITVRRDAKNQTDKVVVQTIRRPTRTK